MTRGLSDRPSASTPDTLDPSTPDTKTEEEVPSDTKIECHLSPSLFCSLSFHDGDDEGLRRPDYPGPTLFAVPPIRHGSGLPFPP